MFKETMKYILIIPLLIISFYLGVHYENYRLIGEPDTTIAVMLSAMAINNSKYQLELNSKYIKLIESGELEILKEQVVANSEMIYEVKSEAMSVCEEVACSEKHARIISNAFNN